MSSDNLCIGLFISETKRGIRYIFNKLRDHKQMIDQIDKRSFGVLSDNEINNRLDELFNTPVKSDDVQPCSVDLHLDNLLLNLDDEEFNLKEEEYVLQPAEFILGSTKEYVTIPDDLVAQVDGKSSLGRLGIAIHITAGWIDAGFNGNITLEIKNNSNKPFVLKNGMSIGQIVFITLTSPCNLPYGHSKRNNHYQNSNGVISSRYE